MPRGKRPTTGPGANPGMRYTHTELAVHLGVSEAAVRVAATKGRITPGPDGRFDVDAAVQDWQGTRGGPPRPGRPAKGPRQGESLLEVQTRHELVKVAERELKLAKARALVIDKRAVEAEVFALIRAERESWL